MNWFWNLVARLLARPRVARIVIQRALRTPYTDIVGDDGSTYMRRWWLFNPYFDGYGLPRFAWLPLSVRLHHILRPDADENLHDHPWNARTFVLLGAYVEVREGGRWFTRYCGQSASLKYGEFHRITSVAHGVGAMTLFVTFRKRGSWGFLVNGRKVPWHEHLSSKG